MELRDLQEKVNIFTNTLNLNTPITARALDLVSEVGEVSKEILRGNNYGKDEFVMTEDLELELGDVLFSLLCLANDTDVDIEKSLDRVLDKYQRRFKARGHIGSK